ncbi:MAG TPA: hypothetical protein VL201_04935 [Patescibacteria group bacterium]|jgi:hypothetical protein|nr:hypothetical protein [Patescibacteria group bacterium]
MISYKLFPIFFFQAFFASEKARGWQDVIPTFLKEAITFRVHNITVESGAISARGGKPDQEDAILFCLGLNDHESIQKDSVCLSKKNNPKNSVWFGVFDGHGENGRGNKISILVAEYFKNFIEQQQSVWRFF